MRWYLTLGLLAVLPSAALGQTGAFTGVVTRDTLGTPVAGADIALSDVNRSLRTDARGAFRFGEVPAGQHTVVVRAIGYELFYAQIDMTAGTTLDADLTLTRVPVVLDTVISRGIGRDKTPWMLREFESRRKTAASGQFVTDSTLRQHEDEMLSSIVGMFAGARLVKVNTATVLYSARGSSGPAFSRPKPGGCPVVAYENGIAIGEGPDVGSLRVSDYSAIEFYASPAEAPAQYSRTGNGCGVILLWRRQRP